MSLVSKHAVYTWLCITYYVYVYHDFWEKLRCSWNSAKYLAKSSTDAALEAMHTRMYALLRWRTYRRHLSEFLEHLASDNGADIHKHNTLYTHRLYWHVLTPNS